MRRFINGLVLGIIPGAVGYWFIQKRRNIPKRSNTSSNPPRRASHSAGVAAHNVSDAMEAKFETLDLTPSNQGRTCQDMRSRPPKPYDIGETAVNVSSDARAVTEIKAKYAMDSTLSVWKISVSCDQGHVTLSGTAAYLRKTSARRSALALDADGVRDVTSTIQVKTNQ